MNPALDAPFLPNPFEPSAEPAPAPKIESEIVALLAELASRDAKIAALEATILRQEREIARLKLDWLDQGGPTAPAMPKCIPGPADVFPLGIVPAGTVLTNELLNSLLFPTATIAATQPHPPAAPVQSIMSQAQCQRSSAKIAEILSKPTPWAHLLRSNLDSDN